MPEFRKRAVSAEDNIGQERYELYKSAFTWIKKSIDEGYYLESISIIESLITDRLESYLSSLTNVDFSFKTLGNLIDAINSHERDNTLRSLVLIELNEWRKARNKAAHEMVKIECGERISWDERVEINKTVAETGLTLVRKIDNRVRRIRPRN